ncbi:MULTISPECIES: LacI family DNA-binding transcriptional regulator [unclassified Actinomyces]|uniref:LacI family DNA-binding transcriptional regulator n=1 Tax=unclassified Actinomyces TaxID=2609248 RepID=UPI0013A6D170|nr:MULTISPECIES: LacI family DNA-binding transcriptional regulator [unclassified Actinomyces]MBW3070175.1 LacI family transcriptional regulator [Actinomyces sp. 594]NDR54807.1 LacI family transcriptional regulator [Actinomyces sp. 565]
MAATLLDVAALAGVSPKTVSRVVNGEPGVSPTTRERVLAAVARTSYCPNASARSLRTGHSNTIGLAVPELNQPFFAEIADRIAAEARRHDLAVVLGVTGERGQWEARFLADHPDLDGTIMYWQGMAPEEVTEAASRYRLVLLGERRHDVVDRVAMDNDCGIGLVVSHLRALGRKHIAALGVASEGEWTHAAALTRTAALRAALSQHGLELDERLLVASSEWRPIDGANAVRVLLDRGIGFDAVIAFNDALALGALHELAASGIRIPQDVAVTGIDNLELSRYTSPSLTTVSPSLGAYAADAVSLLRRRIAAPDAPARTVIEDVVLLARDSTVGGEAPWPRA